MQYLYQDQHRIAAEINPNSTIKRRYVYGSKHNIPEYYIEGSAKYRIVSDQLGSPRVVFNMANGSIIAEMNLDEFGNLISNTNATFKLPFGFAGGLYDWDTKILRFGARDYDAAIGRWLSKDPILFNGGGTNLYGYVLNDPINLIDPKGTFAHIVVGAAVGGAVGAIGGAINAPAGCKLVGAIAGGIGGAVGGGVAAITAGTTTILGGIFGYGLDMGATVAGHHFAIECEPPPPPSCHK